MIFFYVGFICINKKSDTSNFKKNLILIKSLITGCLSILFFHQLKNLRKRKLDKRRIFDNRTKHFDESNKKN